MDKKNVQNSKTQNTFWNKIHEILRNNIINCQNNLKKIK
jgi:hypothetical protein